MFVCSPAPVTWPAPIASPSRCPTGPRSPICAASWSRCYPRLADLMGKCAAAVGAEFAADDAPLTEGDEIALLPPVSGG